MTTQTLHPGEVLNELFIKENGLSISKTAMNIGVSRQSLSELVNGKNGITAQTALRLAKAFNTSPRYWMNLQANVDSLISAISKHFQI